MTTTKPSEKSLRIVFEAAMEVAGWRPKHDLWGTLYAWEHDDTPGSLLDTDVYKHWRMSGTTPEPIPF